MENVSSGCFSNTGVDDEEDALVEPATALTDFFETAFVDGVRSVGACTDHCKSIGKNKYSGKYKMLEILLVDTDVDDDDDGR